MSSYRDLEPEFLEIYERCKSYTMTSVERMYALYHAVKYIVDADIPGDFVECGVWRGGSVMLIAATLLAKGRSDRRIVLYDTFEGMSAPTAEDLDLDGVPAASMLAAASNREESLIWCFAHLEEVKLNLKTLSYPFERFIFVKGKVEDTVSVDRPQMIALLRLDTDWYESTKVELQELFPRVSKGGVLIIDDYGHWRGSKKAVDEYFETVTSGSKVLLNRIDYTGRIGVKG